MSSEQNPWPCFGIDFGTSSTVISAPLRSFMKSSSLSSNLSQFISCTLNGDGERSYPTQLVLENNVRRIPRNSERSHQITAFKEKLGEYKRMNVPSVDWKCNELYLQSHIFESPYRSTNVLSAFSVEQITGMFLRKVIDECVGPADTPQNSSKSIPQTTQKDFLSRASVVLSVPTSWNQSQRQALLAAAEICSLNVLSVVYETTAAAIAFTQLKYVLLQHPISPFTLVIIDCGSSALHISFFHLSRMKNGTRLTSLSHVWSLDVSGNRMTQLLVDEVQRRLLEAYPASSTLIRDDLDFGQTLWDLCENIKICLSSEVSVTKSISLGEGKSDASVTVTRTEYEALIAPLAEILENTVKSGVDDALARISRLTQETSMSSSFSLYSEADTSTLKLDAIELIGQATRTPFLQNVLETLFGACKLTHSQDLSISPSPVSTSSRPLFVSPESIPCYPDLGVKVRRTLSDSEAVSYGCAVLADHLQIADFVRMKKEENSEIPLPSLIEQLDRTLDLEIGKRRRLELTEILTRDVVVYARHRPTPTFSRPSDESAADTIRADSPSSDDEPHPPVDFPFSPFSVPSDAASKSVLFRKGDPYTTKSTVFLPLPTHSSELTEVLVEAHTPQTPSLSHNSPDFAVPSCLSAMLVECPESTTSVGIVGEIDSSGIVSLQHVIAVPPSTENDTPLPIQQPTPVHPTTHFPVAPRTTSPHSITTPSTLPASTPPPNLADAVTLSPHVLYTGRTDPRVMQQWVDEELKMLRQDMRQKDSETKRAQLEDLCLTLETELGSGKRQMKQQDEAELRLKLGEIRTWLGDQPTRPDVGELKRKTQDLESLVSRMDKKQKEDEKRKKERDSLRKTVQKAQKHVPRLSALRTLFESEVAAFERALDNAEQLLDSQEEPGSTNQFRKNRERLETVTTTIEELMRRRDGMRKGEGKEKDRTDSNQSNKTVHSVMLNTQQSFATRPTPPDDLTCPDSFWGSSTGWPRYMAIEDDNTITPTALTRSDVSCTVFRFELAGCHADDIRVAIVDDGLSVEAVKRNGTQSRVDALYDFLNQISTLPIDTSVTQHFSIVVPLPTFSCKQVISSEFTNDILYIYFENEGDE
ncbi:putative Hsp70 protein [Blattamonas nauphoetae]|uniref:Hsp70 protein n=1 Tax=Blattamonas nauphoetae TaxID=2049346 RepID=A0ABQ9XH40_9EUKA|nr:putative Hsp70 protein [Blattamonas nauphoetae]